MKRLLFIFDYDGTLCDTRHAIASSLLSTFAELSTIVPSQADVARLISMGVSLRETIIALHSGADNVPDDTALEQWVGFYRRYYAERGESKVSLFDGVNSALSALRPIGACVLVSNKGIDAVERSLERFHVRHHFDLVLAEEPGQPQKPDPAVYTKRIAPHFPDISPEHIVVIGDTASDLELARAIGAMACWATYGFGDRAACEAIGYHHAVSALSQLVDFYADASQNA